jgi:HlyD family secretion protein
MPKKRKGKRKRWVIVIMALLVLIVIGNMLSSDNSDETVINPIEVEKGEIVRRLTESGTIEMDRMVEVKSQVSGRITRLYSDVGDSIRAGALLAIIEPDPNKALQLSGKRASVTRAEMELTEQRRQLDQKRQNYIDGIIPRDEIERAEYLFVLAENSLSQQRLELQILEREVSVQARAVQAVRDSLLFEDYEIVAPFKGIVTERPVEIGELVTSAVSTNQGTILFKVGDPDHLIVKVEISEIDIGEVFPGAEAEIKVDALPGEVFPGRLRHVAPTGTIRSGSAVVTFDAEVAIIGSFRQLRHGMTADVDLILGRAEDTLYLPVEGVAEIFKKDEEGKETEEIERRIVFVKTSDSREEREVTTGLESNTRIEILDGLELGEEVHPDAQAELERRSGDQEESAGSDTGRPG